MSAYVRGNDDDLAAAIDYNETGITVPQVAEVLAVVYGEHDESGYYWVLRLADGTVGMLQGHHDYNGWDCQSDALWTPADSPEAAVTLALDDCEIGGYSSWSGFNDRPVREFLLEQLQGVPPERSGYQVAMARMGFPKTRP